jgi:hypothetical protein
MFEVFVDRPRLMFGMACLFLVLNCAALCMFLSAFKEQEHELESQHKILDHLKSQNDSLADRVKNLEKLTVAIKANNKDVELLGNLTLKGDTIHFDVDKAQLTTNNKEGRKVGVP